MVAVDAVATDVVPTVKVAVVAPAGTVTFAGTVAYAAFDVSPTTTPPSGATLLSVTVPVEELPPTTEVGLSEMLLRAAELMAKVAVACLPLD